MQRHDRRYRNEMPRQRPTRRRKRGFSRGIIVFALLLAIVVSTVSIFISLNPDVLDIAQTVFSPRRVDTPQVDTEYISWDFRTYAEPDFTSQVIGYHPPQEIMPYHRREDGWALLRADDVDKWVYTPRQRRHIPRYTGLFANMGDTQYTGIMAPHVVDIIEVHGDWLLIDAGESEMWIYMNFMPSTDGFDNFLYHLGTDVAVFYKNLDTGLYYFFNPDRIFFAASLSKANHALYVYTLAERGYLDMYAVHTFTAADYWGGTGIMRFKPAGTRFTTRELLAHSIIYSCNIAYRMLIRYTENMAFSYRDFVRELGADEEFILNVISQNSSARDMSIWMNAIHEYLQSDSSYGHYFKYDLMNTAQTSHHYFTRWEGSFGTGGEVDLSMIQSGYPFARKYGWSPGAFHDAAIVYAPSPFVLIVMSNMDRGAHYLFGEIAEYFEGFNGRWFDGV